MPPRKAAKRPSEAQRSFLDAMPAPAKAGPVEHHCSVCGDLNAPFGEGVFLRLGKPGTWFCHSCWQERPS